MTPSHAPPPRRSLSQSGNSPSGRLSPGTLGQTETDGVGTGFGVGVGSGIHGEGTGTPDGETVGQGSGLSDGVGPGVGVWTGGVGSFGTQLAIAGGLASGTVMAGSAGAAPVWHWGLADCELTWSQPGFATKYWRSPPQG